MPDPSTDMHASLHAFKPGLSGLQNFFLRILDKVLFKLIISFLFKKIYLIIPYFSNEIKVFNVMFAIMFFNNYI